MHVQDQILEFLSVTGPTVPTKVAKTIQTDIIIASAHLSDLAAQGKVRISSLKVGGSPLYYLSGQEEKLYDFAPSNLNPKDLAVLERLKNEKVLREADLDLLSKVALRALKDFAVPLQVRTSERSELFWKWHLLPDEATNPLVRDILYPPLPVEHAEPLSVEQEYIKTDASIKADVPELSQTFPSLEVEWSGEEAGALDHLSHSELPVAELINHVSNKHMPDNQVTEVHPGENPEITFPKKGRPPKHVNLSPSSTTPLQPLLSSSNTAPVLPDHSLPNDTSQTLLTTKEHQVKVKALSVKKTESKIESNKSKLDSNKKKADTFLPLVENFLRDLNITIQEQEVRRRNTEINLSIKVPTVVGKITYLCKAKKKARCDEKDISAAYLEAQAKKQPLLFLYSHELSRKAQEMIAAGSFENLIVKKVE